MGFRGDFIWGAATASYQIEGAARRSGIYMPTRRARCFSGTPATWPVTTTTALPGMRR